MHGLNVVICSVRFEQYNVRRINRILSDGKGSLSSRRNIIEDFPQLSSNRRDGRAV
jgi:hypothetical protein